MEQVHERLNEIADLSRRLALAFDHAGFSLYAVGGAVRDALLGLARGE